MQQNTKFKLHSSYINLTMHDKERDRKVSIKEFNENRETTPLLIIYSPAYAF